MKKDLTEETPEKEGSWEQTTMGRTFSEKSSEENSKKSMEYR